MDAKLIAWARAVKARRRGRLPPLWVFTDRDRLPDPRATLGAIPRGLCGVVLRPGGCAPGLAAAVALFCRRRGVPLVVSGERGEAVGLGAGRHLSRGRAGRAPGAPGGFLTAAAHGRRELVRAVRARVDCVFLSPVFATASHPGAAGLGVIRWAGLTRGCPVPVLALGGVTGATARRLPRHCAGAGLIGAAIEVGVQTGGAVDRRAVAGGGGVTFPTRPGAVLTEARDA